MNIKIGDKVKIKEKYFENFKDFLWFKISTHNNKNIIFTVDSICTDNDNCFVYVLENPFLWDFDWVEKTDYLKMGIE